jgi:D-glycero-D-manno-heptose 1,7-bisphosphate phosphatase
VRAGWSGSPELGPLTLAAFDARHPPPGCPAAFLDRDGTLNEAAPDPDSGVRESPLTLADVRLIPGATDAAIQLMEAGYVLVCATNQPAAAKGRASLQRLLEIHERVLDLLAAEGVRIELSLLCPHHPEGLAGELSRRCSCRKPAPGMLLDAAAELDLDIGSSWMLGDTDSDVGAGRAAGCHTALIDYPGSGHKRRGEQTADVFAANLGRAVAQLLDHRRR